MASADKIYFVWLPCKEARGYVPVREIFESYFVAGCTNIVFFCDEEIIFGVCLIRFVIVLM